MTGDIELSKSFFQSFHEGTVPPGFKPILQILEARQLTGPQSSYRVRLSDSVFSYSACGVSNALRDRFHDDELNEHNAIIRITEYKVNEGQKRSLTILNYDLLDMDSPVIGNPQSHTGKAEDYRGIQKMQLGNLGGERQSERQPVKRPASPRSENREPFRKRAPSGNVAAYEKTEIALITPYINKWRICGIVTSKENIRNLRNAKGEFRVFSFVVTDQDGNAIKVTGFGEQADKFHPMLQNDQTYYISGGGGGSVKAANKQYNSTGHDYELTLGRDSEISLCTDMKVEQPKFKLNAIPLSRVVEHINECIDVLAVVDRTSELTQVTTRAEQKQLDKRDIYLVDETLNEISLTLWGDQARDFDLKTVHQVVGIKGANVKEFNGGVSLSINPGCTMNFNPEGPATYKLYAWYESARPNSEVKTLSSTFSDSAGSFERDFRLIGVAVQHHLGRDSDKGVYFNVKAMINNIKTENAIYSGCMTEGCKKKMTQDGAGQYRCEKCNATFDSCKNILMLQVEIADFSGTAWTTIFEDKAALLLETSADKLAQLKNESTSLYDAVFERIRFRDYNIRVRVKYEMYNDQQQMRWNIVDLKPVPYDKCKKLINDAIQKCEHLSI